MPKLLPIIAGLLLLPAIALAQPSPNPSADYRSYHRQITAAETLIAEAEFEEALLIYDRVFAAYDFVFRRDYQVATQVALHVGAQKKAIEYLRAGIASGWELQSIRKQSYLTALRSNPAFAAIEEQYRGLRQTYETGLNQPLRRQVHKLYRKDQWKALGALLRIGDRAQERYAERKFAPHSEAQLAQLSEVLTRHGYPGERLIGNNYWGSTILSHHNSIFRAHVRNDTLYPALRPALLAALAKGQLSPYEYAMIEDWRLAVSSDRTAVGYGFLNPPTRNTLAAMNALRQEIGLRTIELRNRLVATERRTGMDFYLPDWVAGEIVVE